jgi:signal transduction histidine kinase
MFSTQSEEGLISQLCEHQPEAIAWYRPVYEADRITDFEVRYCNASCLRLAGSTRGAVYGLRVLRDDFPDPSLKQVKFEQCLKVFTTGEPLEYSYFSTHLEKYITLSRVKVNEGILVIARNRTAEYLADQERQQREIEKQRQLTEFEDTLNLSADGIMTLQALRHRNGAIEDFRILQCNRSGRNLFGLPAEGSTATLLQALPSLRGTELFHQHCRVVEEGEAYSAELSLDLHGNGARWFLISLARLGDGVVANFIDITPQKELAMTVARQSALLESLVENVPSAVLLYAPEGNAVAPSGFRLQLCNHWAEVFTGLSREQLNSYSLHALLQTWNDARFQQLASEVVESGESRAAEYYSAADSRWFQVYLIRLNSGLLLLKLTDITHSKTNELLLEEKNHLLERILNSSLMGISYLRVLRGPEGKLLDLVFEEVNEEVPKRYGKSKGEMLNARYLQLFPEAVELGIWEKMVRVLDQKQPLRFQQRYVFQQKELWFDISFSPVGEDHLLMNAVEITEMVESRRQIEETVQHLQRSNKNLEEFALAASHDLQEPLRKVQFFMNQLHERYGTSLPEEGSRLLRRAEYAAARMSRLVDDLLTYSKVGMNEPRLERLSLQEVVQDVLTDLEVRIAERGAVIEMEALPELQGNSELLKRAFHNLISNSLKYADPVRPLRIGILHEKIETEPPADYSFDRKSGTYHHLSIQDNGIGFHNREGERIFQVFQRLHGNTEYEGSGIGLAIVKKIVEHHRGFIRAEGQEGRGACFHLYFPAGV